MRFRNHYTHCDEYWNTIWGSTCNHPCPWCNKEIEPFWSEDLRAKKKQLTQGWTNQERGNRIPPLIGLYTRSPFGSEDIQMHLGDMLADIMHFCHQRGFDFWDILQHSEYHFQEELKADDERF